MNKNLKIGLVVAGVSVVAYGIYALFFKAQTPKKTFDTPPTTNTFTKETCEAGGYTWNADKGICIGS